MATYPVNSKMRCKHPHPHRNVMRSPDFSFCDGCHYVHCIGNDTSCMKDFCHKDNYINHPHQHCNFDDPHDHYDDHWCPYDRYKTYHGHMHIDPCHHAHEMVTTPVYDYDYERNTYVPNYRGDAGLVLNIDYKVKNTIDIDITYENGMSLVGEVSEGGTYDFIYADSGVLKRDVGILNKITVTNGTVPDTRLGYSQLTDVASIYLEFDCSSKGNSHIVNLDINLLRSIALVTEDDTDEDEVVIKTKDGTTYETISVALDACKDGDTLYGNSKFEINEDLTVDKAVSLDGFIFNNSKLSYDSIETENIVYITNNTFNNGSSLITTGIIDEVVLDSNTFTSDIPYTEDLGVRTPVTINSTGSVTITNNIFNSIECAYYNDIELDSENGALKSSTISNNKFNGSIYNDAIVITNVEENALIVIKDNVFEHSANPIKLSNYSNVEAIFRFINNTYLHSDTKEEDAGFINLAQINEEDFSKYSIYIEELYFRGHHLTEVGTGEKRVWYTTDTETIPKVVFF
jgi:hypothetical protein